MQADANRERSYGNDVRCIGMLFGISGCSPGCTTFCTCNHKMQWGSCFHLLGVPTHVLIAGDLSCSPLATLSSPKIWIFIDFEIRDYNVFTIPGNVGLTEKRFAIFECLVVCFGNFVKHWVLVQHILNGRVLRTSHPDTPWLRCRGVRGWALGYFSKCVASIFFNVL